jgi:hypothetical protein
MDEDFDLVSAMLAVALCAVLLVAGQQYLLKHPDIDAASARPQRVVGSLAFRSEISQSIDESIK